MTAPSQSRPAKADQPGLAPPSSSRSESQPSSTPAPAAPAAPAPTDNDDDNAKIAPDRDAHSVEDPHADGSDRANETETPQAPGM